MGKDDNSVKIKVGEELTPGDPGSHLLNFDKEMPEIEKMIAESVTESGNVAEEQSISETEVAEEKVEQSEVEDAETKQEEVVEESMVEEKVGVTYYTDEELETLPWEEISQHEDRIPPAARGTYKSQVKAFYKKSERDAEIRRDALEAKERAAKLEKIILEEKQHNAELRRRAEEAERIRRLEELEPDERIRHEVDYKLKESEQRYAKLQKDIEDMRVNNFYADLGRNVDVAIAELGVKDESVINDLRKDVMTELPEEFRASEQSGIPVDFKVIPKRVTKKVYDRYVNIAKKIFEADPSFDETKKKLGKEAVTKVIETNKKGATVIKSTPTGGNIPKPEPELPKEMTESDFNRMFDKDPEIQKLLEEARRG